MTFRPRIAPFSFALLLGCFVLPAAGCRGPAAPRAVDGRLDLAAWDFGRDGLLALDGAWELYWRQALTPADFAGPAEFRPRPSALAVVPGLWNGLAVDGRALPATGYATYRLRVTLPASNMVLTLKVQRASTAYRLWIGGRLALESGTPGTNRASTTPGIGPRVATFRAPAAATEIVVQVANFEDREGGLGQPLLLGTEAQVAGYTLTRIALSLAMAGILAIIAFYHLMLYAQWPRDRTTLWFAAFCLLFALRALCDGEAFLLMLVPALAPADFIRIWYLTFFLAVPVFYAYLRRTFPAELWRGVGAGFWAVGGLASAIVVLAPLDVFVHVLTPYQYATLAGLVLAVVAVVRALRRRREAALPVAVGLAVFGATAVNDILHAQHVITTEFVAPYGLLVFVCSQAFLISRRFSRSFRRVEALSTELSAANQQLRDYSRDLEHEVETRTRELYAEKDKLERRNRVMEEELVIARRIQLSAIPTSHPLPGLYSFYRPMDKVGGDFYDFITFREPERVGLFLSDVSGHGVPAALIASMLKSLLLQAGEAKADPARLLTRLNAYLHGQTAGNYITVFYGIFDRRDRSFTWANAGHPVPLVVHGGSVAKLDAGHRSLPVAVLPNEDLAKLGRPYTNDTVTLPAGGRLVLFSDGLVEATPGNNVADHFDDAGLEAALIEAGELPAQAFVERTYRRLVEFRGGEKFEDDVCLVCLET